MSYQFGTFVWYEIHTNDPKKASVYYEEVLGWKVEEMDMGGMPYLMLRSADDKMQMGIVQSPQEGVPSHFVQYLSVEDVDKIAAAAEKAGGKVLVPGMDIPVGRFAIIQDAQGAALAIFKGKESDDNASTAFHWNELWSPDAEKALPFYQEVFAATTESMPMPGMDKPYHILKVGENSMGGAMTSPAPGVPPMWLPYVKAPDLEASVERAKARGAELLSPIQDVPNVGRFAITKDPQGAALGFITPSKN